MVGLLNFIVLAALLAIGGGIVAIGVNFGGAAMLWLAAGWAGSTILWQCAHRSRYGQWFKKPTIILDQRGRPSRPLREDLEPSS